MSTLAKLISKAAVLSFCLSLMPLLSAAQQKTATPQAQTPKLSYEELLAKVKKQDASADFTALRLAYTETKDYSPYAGDRAARKNMFAAIQAKEFAKALELSDALLKTNYVDANAHFGAFVAHRELGHPEQSAYHKWVVQGLMKSIADSGDGKKPETAMVVISTDEEYTWFNFMGLRPAGQALLSENGHSYDKMTAVDPNTKESSIFYFNIDKPFSWLGDSLKSKP